MGQEVIKVSTCEEQKIHSAQNAYKNVSSIPLTRCADI